MDVRRRLTIRVTSPERGVIKLRKQIARRLGLRFGLNPNACVGPCGCICVSSKSSVVSSASSVSSLSIASKSSITSITSITSSSIKICTAPLCLLVTLTGIPNCLNGIQVIVLYNSVTIRWEGSFVVCGTTIFIYVYVSGSNYCIQLICDGDSSTACVSNVICNPFFFTANLRNCLSSSSGSSSSSIICCPNTCYTFTLSGLDCPLNGTYVLLANGSCVWITGSVSSSSSSSSSSSMSSSSSSIAYVPCCQNGLPTVLYGTITNLSGCACLDGEVLTFRWDSGFSLWRSTITASCSNPPAPVVLECNNNSWGLGIAGVNPAGCVGNFGTGSWTCSPLNITFSPVSITGCCTGTIKVVVTA